MFFSKFFFMVFFFVVSCGYNPQTDKNLAPDGQPYGNPSAAVLSEMQSDQVEVSGYVASISITVDGNFYEDGEDFYTQELTRLEGIVAAEYPSYTFSLEADVGVRDLKRGLAVFLVSENDGFADESKVDSKGKFSFYVPKTVVSDKYLIRAYKRIGLRLTPPNETEKEIYWCYNMYAERMKTLEKASMILRDFTTKITKYKCETGTGASGLQIPSSSSVQDEIDDDPSLTPEEIADITNSLNTDESEPAPEPAVEPTPTPTPEPVVQENQENQENQGLNFTLRSGEYLWSSAGTHVFDENGFSTRCTEDTVVTFDSQEIKDRAVAIIRNDRTYRGVNPDTGL